MSVPHAVLSTPSTAPTPPPILAPAGPPRSGPDGDAGRQTAIIYCEAEFASIDGKTANGLVRHSEKYRILCVIDSTKPGLDTGTLLDDVANGIPVSADLEDAITSAGGVPDVFIFGKAPASGRLLPHERQIVLSAMRLGMNIVIGLHEFLNDDPEFSAASASHKVSIDDVRRPRARADLRSFGGHLKDMPCLRIAVLGTDCAIGKRTTAVLLTRALNRYGIRALMVGTGQTGLIQGARYGLALDAVPSQFCSGELEATIVEAFEAEHPEVIVIEGQGALSHPAYSTSSFILRGSTPHAVVLQHAPARVHRCDFEQMDMPEPASEIHLIETFARTRVIGLTLNHEGMDEAETDRAQAQFEIELGIPVTDALRRPGDELVQMVLDAFPQLRKGVPAHAA